MKITTQDEWQRIEAERAAGRTVVLDFYADWCGPCKRYAPIFDEVAAERDELFASVDCEALPAVAQGYFIQGIPCTVILRAKQEPVYQSGLINRQQLIEFIEQQQDDHTQTVHILPSPATD